METPIGSEADTTVGDLITDPEPAAPERLAMERSHLILRKLLEGLTPRERLIIERRFGFNGADTATLRELGNHLHLSRERVRQVEEETLSKLRARLAPDEVEA